jgi:hypothetical protein
VVPGPGHSRKDRSLKVWDFNGKIYVYSFVGDDWRDCRAHLGLDGDRDDRAPAVRHPRPDSLPARPSRRCRDLLRTSASIDMVPDAVAYLQARKLWPLPKGCPLKAHAGADYWDQGAERPIRVGKYPALIAPVVDVDGELVTVHITYLENGWKLQGRTCRKLLSGAHGRQGCAVRLMPFGPRLAVAEGIETALAASRLLKVPCWSCLNTSLLQAFTPPPGVEELIVAQDNDAAGRLAAEKLQLRLRDMVTVTVRAPFLGDFAEDLAA